MLLWLLRAAIGAMVAILIWYAATDHAPRWRFVARLTIACWLVLLLLTFMVPVSPLFPPATHLQYDPRCPTKLSEYGVCVNADLTPNITPLSQP